MSPRAARPWLALVLLGLAAAAPGTAWFFLARRAPPRPAGPAQRAGDEVLKAALDAVPPASELRSPPSIAVLPFADMSAAKDQEYFSDGVAEEILDALAQVEGLRVIGRTSSFSFKGRTEDLRAIGSKLQVGHLLEGSVRKAGNRVRVTAQLIETAGGSHLWSQTFERELTDLFAVQQEIARATAAALQAKLHLPLAAGPRERGAASPEAYNQFLLGRQFFSRGNLADYVRAQQAFQKAVDLDPSYAAAWAGLAHARYWVADSGLTIAAIAAGQEQARAAADRAVALRPDIPDGYVARGWHRAVVLWDLAGATEDVQRALAIAPESPDVLVTYATVLSTTGHLQEAEAALRKAIGLDPLNPRSWSLLGETLLDLGQMASAREALERALEVSPDEVIAVTYLGLIPILEGRPAESLALARQPSFDLFREELAALAHHDLGHEKEAEAALGRMIAKNADGGAYQIAQVHARWGRTDAAFQWLERAKRQRDGGLMLLKNDQLLRNLHGDPRWRPLLRSVNLPVE